jgi:hypothetical protein
MYTSSSPFKSDSYFKPNCDVLLFAFHSRCEVLCGDSRPSPHPLQFESGTAEPGSRAAVLQALFRQKRGDAQEIVPRETKDCLPSVNKSREFTKLSVCSLIWPPTLFTCSWPGAHGQAGSCGAVTAPLLKAEDAIEELSRWLGQ